MVSMMKQEKQCRHRIPQDGTARRTYEAESTVKLADATVRGSLMMVPEPNTDRAGSNNSSIPVTVGGKPKNAATGMVVMKFSMPGSLLMRLGRMTE